MYAFSLTHNLLTGENHVMLWHSIVQELWKRSPKMTSKEQQQTSSALLKKSHQGMQKANPLCLNKSVIIFCLSVLSTPVDSCDPECFALFLLSLFSFVWILSSFMIIICSDLIKILNYQSYTHEKKTCILQQFYKDSTCLK